MQFPGTPACVPTQGLRADGYQKLQIVVYKFGVALALLEPGLIYPAPQLLTSAVTLEWLKRNVQELATGSRDPLSWLLRVRAPPPIPDALNAGAQLTTMPCSLSVITPAELTLI